MVKKKQTRKKKNAYEPDSLFFLKLVVLLIVGSQWIFINSGDNWQIPVPIGFILGLVMVTHEHFQIDRKIEYALLIIASFIAFWLPVGIVVQL